MKRRVFLPAQEQWSNNSGKGEQHMWSDLPSDHWASQFIQALADRDILQGFPDGRFYADANITRAQFAAVISKAFSKPDSRGPIQFQDVALSHWAAEAIQSAYQQGFLSGYPNQRFKPEQPITRAEMLVSLANGLGYTPAIEVETTLAKYQDSARIPAFAKSPIATATEKNLVVNYPKIKALNPRQNATRADVAATLYQALVSLGEAPQIVSPYLANPPEANPSETSPTEAAAQWIEQLQDPDETVRQQATQSLIESDAEAVPALVNALQTNTAVQSSVADILVNIGAKATPVLAAALQQDSGVQQVMDVLVRIGSVSALIGILENNETLERTGTVLTRIGQPAVPELIAALQKETLHDKAVAILGQIGEPALASLVASLNNESTLLQTGVAAVLKQIGQPGITALVEALSTPDNKLKAGITAVVKQLDQPAIAGLVAALQKDNLPLRETIADVLAQVGQPAIAQLVTELQTENQSLQENVSFVLQKIGQPAVSGLISLVLNDQSTTRERAANVLTAIGQPAVSELITSLNKESLLKSDSKAGQLIQKTLGQVIGSDAVSILMTSLRTYYNQSSPGDSGSEAGNVTHTLLEQLNLLKTAGEDTSQLDNIAQALTQLGQPALQGVTDLLQDDNPLVKVGAAYVLGKMGSKATAAIPSLIQYLRDGDAKVRATINTALNQIDPVLTRVLLMASLLSGEQPQERAEAAQSIGVLASADLNRTVAVPDFVDQALSSALETAQQADESPTVRAASAAALP